MYLTLTLFIISHVGFYGIKGDCQWEDSYISGRYYIIGLYKMYTDYDKVQYDENAIRLHLKLR